MLTLYAKFIDKVIPRDLEKRFRLGRRYGEDRRLSGEDRRIHIDENFRYNQSERRASEETRRSPDLDERRKRWFRINSFQSRHFS